MLYIENLHIDLIHKWRSIYIILLYVWPNFRVNILLNFAHAKEACTCRAA